MVERAALLLTLPGYYQSDVPATADFDQPLPVIAASGGVSYGTVAAGPAAGVAVSYRRVFVAEEGCVCFVRQEAAAQRVIVRRAEELALRITVAADGKSALLEASFSAPWSAARPLVSTSDQVLLRNRRTDAAE